MSDHSLHMYFSSTSRAYLDELVGEYGISITGVFQVVGQELALLDCANIDQERRYVLGIDRLAIAARKVDAAHRRRRKRDRSEAQPLRPAEPCIITPPRGHELVGAGELTDVKPVKPGVHAYLTLEAPQGLHKFAEAHKVSVSGLVEALLRSLSPGAFIDLRQVVSAGRQVDRKRRTAVGQ